MIEGLPLLNRVKLYWTNDEGKEESKIFEGFTFEGFKKKIEDFLEEQGLSVHNNKCWMEVL